MRSVKWLIRVNLFAIGFCAGSFLHGPNLSATSPHFRVAMVTKDSGQSAHQPVWHCTCDSSRVVTIRKPFMPVSDAGENAREDPYNRGPVCNHGF